jgi:type-F conjugative transfer system pilin assembly protein TrbC
MAKKKLLHALVVITALVIWSPISLGKEFDFGARGNEILLPSEKEPGLFVFISTSMPPALLKEYRIAAEKYGAALVLRGLPEGSFHKLAEFVTELQGEKGKAAMFIDQEAFERFAIDSVPSIVLTSPSDAANINSGELYDKVLGNVGIKGALRTIAERGENAAHARELLNKAEK